MPVWLKNFQSAVALNELLLKMHCTFLLHAARAGRFDVSVVCVDDQEMRHLNETYRRVAAPTDILSFPYHEDLTPGTLPTLSRKCDYSLGDIILSLPLIAEQCECDGVRMEGERLPVLVTHGLCHLMGYTHNTHLAWTKMYSREALLLKAFNNTFGTRLVPLTEVHS